MKKTLFVVLNLTIGCIALLGSAIKDGYAEQQPGLYGQPYHGYINRYQDWDDIRRRWYWTEDYSNVKNLHGKVGLPFDEGMRAKCIGSSGETITWYFTSPVRIETGVLPLGLDIDENGRITGVPERAGTWYLQIGWDGVSCAGMNYKGSYLKLKIVTEGSSVPKSLQ